MNKNDSTLKYLISKKILILLSTLFFAFASVMFSLWLPDRYSSQVVLAASERTKNYDNMTGIASASPFSQGGLVGSLAGIGGQNNRNKDIALQLVKSQSFVIGFLEKNELIVPLMAANGWDDDTNRFILKKGIYDEGNKKWLNISENYNRPIGENIMVKWNQVFDVFIERKTGFIILKITHFSPEKVKSWIDLLLLDINNHIREMTIRESEAVIAYLKEEAENTTNDGLRSVFYRLIGEETRKSSLASVSDNYVFDIVDPAIVPQKKSEPWRAMICILGTIFGFIFTISWLAFKRTYHLFMSE